MSGNENQPKNNREFAFPFNAKDFGASMHEVAMDIIRSEDRDIESRWYHSNKDIDLFYWRDEKKNIIKQQMSFLGQIVEWNIIDGVRTGVIIEDESSQSMGASPLVRYDLRPMASAVEQGLDIIGHIPGLPLADKQQIMFHFVHSPNLDTLTVEEIKKRFQIHAPAAVGFSLARIFIRLYQKLGLLLKSK